MEGRVEGGGEREGGWGREGVREGGGEEEGGYGRREERKVFMEGSGKWTNE